MDKDYNAVVSAVEQGSIAEEAGICPGDVIAQINGEDICDYFDYQFLCAAEHVELTVIKPDGSAELLDIEKDMEEDIGLSFEGMLFDHARACSNRCIFCFIDQLPRGMRRSLYFKDDDARLSFLYGNYVTLTNMTDAHIDKIIRYRISPVNISMHTTDPALRVHMLRNKHADHAMDVVARLADAGISMNMQVVLCPGINDGAQLDRTIADIAAYFPHAASISVVPVGLTRYREGLYPLAPFDAAGAAAVIEQVEGWQQRLLAQHGSRIVYLSDEFYVLAGRPLPPYEAYEDFPQIENGVGMIASMQREFEDALPGAVCTAAGERAIATGEFSFDFICGLVKILNMRYNSHIHVYKIRNDFFGGKVTVSGLLCGCDLISQLKGRPLGDTLFITRSMLRTEGDRFLDDLSVEDVERALGVRIVAVDNDGADFIAKLLG